MRHKKNSVWRVALLQQRSRSWCKAQEKKPLDKFGQVLTKMFGEHQLHGLKIDIGSDLTPEVQLANFTAARRVERPGLFESRHVRARKLAAMLRARRA